MHNLLSQTYILPLTARLILVLSIAVSAFVPPTSTSFAQEPIKAFKNLTVPVQLYDRTLRFRQAQMDISHFTKNASLSFDLFPGVSMIIKNKLLEETRPGFTNWAGEVEGSHRTKGRAFFTFKDGKAYGTIHSGSRVYEIRSVGQDIYRITEFDITKFPDEGGGPRPPRPPRPHSDSAIPSGGFTVLSDGASNSPCQIDIMVLYTANAITAAGGVESDLLQQIDTAVGSINLMFINSGIMHRLNLIHTEKVSYNEPATSTQTPHEDILNNLLNPSGTPLSLVPGRRDTKGADIVSLWIDYNSNEYCGWANDMPPLSISPSLDWTNAYNIVEVRCVATKYSLAHEVGHNMGAYHDRATAFLKDTDATDQDNHGDCNENLWQGTIMAKKLGCGGGLFARQPYWSTPTLTYSDGSPMGHLKNTNGAANNSRFINQDTGHLVAKFKGEVCSPPSGSDNSPPAAPLGLRIQ